MRRSVGLLLLLGVALFFTPVAFSGRVLLAADYLKWFYPWHASGLYGDQSHVSNYGSVQDAILQLYPFEDFAVRQVRRGQWPLWDPRTGGGVPLVGLNSVPTFFPLHLGPSLVLSPLVARTLEQALAVGLGGLGMAGFLLSLGRSPVASTLGALAWMLGGWPIAFLQFLSWAWACACLPYVLWALERLAQGNSRARAELALSAGLMLLAGSPQLSLLGAVVATAYALSRLRSPRLWGRAVQAALLALALASFILIPSVELIAQSGRLSTTSGWDSRLVPRELATLVWPFYLGDPGEPFFLGGAVTSQVVNSREHALYVGVLTVLLALAGALGGAPRVWSLLLLGSLLVSLGTPLTALLHTLCPPARAVPLARMLFLTSLSFSVLAAYGWDAARRRPFPQLASLLVLLAAFVVLGTCWRVQTNPASLLTDFPDFQRSGVFRPPYYQGPPYGPWLVARMVEHFQPWHLHIALPLVWLVGAGLALYSRRSGLAVCLMLGDLLFYAGSMNVPVAASLVYPRTPATDYLAQLRLELPAREPPRRVAGLYRLAHPNGLAAYDLCDVGMYASLIPRRYRELLVAIDQEDNSPLLVGLFKAQNYGPRMADLLGVGVHYTDPFHGLPEFCGPPDYGADLLIAPWSGGLRWFTVGSWKRLSSVRDVVSLDPRQQVLLEDDPGHPDGAPGPAGTLEGLLYDAQEVRVRARMDRAGWVVLTDSHYPGWTALVDGRAVPIVRADWCFRAVYLQAGEHDVVMRYQPTGFFPGLGLAAVALLWLAWDYRRGGKGSAA